MITDFTRWCLLLAANLQMLRCDNEHSPPSNLCHPYWYSLKNPAVLKCRETLRVRSRMSVQAILAMAEGGNKISMSEGFVEAVLNLGLQFTECVLSQDDDVYPIDDIVIQEGERTFSQNKFLTQLVATCTNRVDDVCPLRPVLNDDDKNNPRTCIPHPLQLLKCVRELGIPRCNTRRQQEQIKEPVDKKKITNRSYSRTKSQ